MVYKTRAELTQEEAELGAHAYQGYLDSLPMLDAMPFDYALLQIAWHLPSDQPFLLFSRPDGPFFALSPMTGAAERLLLAALPDAVPWQPSDAAGWANRQRWEPVIGLALRRDAERDWEIYDPRVPMPVQAGSIHEQD